VPNNTGQQEICMLGHKGWYSPEQLQTLQKIFDEIWMEFRAKGLGKLDRPSDRDALRAEIACRIFKQLDKETFKAEEITQHVLSSFGMEIEGIRAGKSRKKD
jgi:hypothetical protein